MRQRTAHHLQYALRQIHLPLRLNSRAKCIARPFSVAVKGTIPDRGVGMAVAQYALVERVFTAQDVVTFGNLVQDINPLHHEWQVSNLPAELQSHPLLKDIQKDEGSEGSGTTKVIVHGMLASSLFSCIFGTLVPGAVYLKQTLDFRSPVYVDEMVVGRVDVMRVRQFKSRGVIVTCDTKVLRGDNACVVGKADVWLPGGSKASSH